MLTVGIELGGLFQPEGFCEMVPGALEGLYWDFLCAPGRSQGHCCSQKGLRNVPKNTKWRFAEALECYIGKGSLTGLLVQADMSDTNFISFRSKTGKFPSGTELSVPLLKSILKNWTGNTPGE